MKNPETLMHWCLFERLNRLTKVFKVCPFEYQSDNKQKSEKKKNRRKKCYSDTLGPYNGVQAGLIKGAGTFHSTSQRKEGILVLALPSIRFSWNFYQIISGTIYEKRTYFGPITCLSLQENGKKWPFFSWNFYQFLTFFFIDPFWIKNGQTWQAC